ncbi:hypothetical protein NCCP2716_08540 [Sporosarcina sp. NCCP-2716]|uniref:hypothetical protein n=1 Tax=Sporosarcina sp. NCCP-2716 TaxID=2943679 RepID=UPI002040ED5B|nr:hypothetical protein [Sporosarcina sp. NCCP-2716]GKV68356.1 hypothetical protein NCCP2716_08540 [Sporosarcina sp. NCCP-2716]
MKRWAGMLLVFGVLLLSGCSYTFANEDGYRMAVINEGFPIPKNAYELKPEDCTTEIAKSAKYKMNGIGDEEGTPPAEYLEEIEKWGWTELADARVGNVHYFKKNDKIISLIIQQDVFDVFEMSDEISL